MDRLASTCLDPKSDSRCIDIIQRLDDLTSLNVASYTFDHLSAVCRIASQDQIQAIVTWLINALTTQDSAIHRIFQSATFFEVGPIRNGFLTAWINAVIENAAKAFLPANAAAKEVHSILGQVVGSDLKTLTEKVDTFIGNKLVPSFKTKSKGRQELDRLISGLCLFPIHYFTVSERRQIIVILYILHVMFWSTEDFSRECFTRLLWVLDKFVDECQDSFLMVNRGFRNYEDF